MRLLPPSLPLPMKLLPDIATVISYAPGSTEISDTTAMYAETSKGMRSAEANKDTRSAEATNNC